MGHVVVTHLGGLSDFKVNGTYTVFADEAGLTFQSGTFKKTDVRTFRWDEAEIVAGTDEEVRERITLTRVAIAGPFAVLFKKSQKKHLITVSQGEEAGIFEVAGISLDDYRRKIKQIVDVKNLIPKAQDNKPIAGDNDIDKLERLAALLEKGLLTQEEFDSKKRELFNS